MHLFGFSLVDLEESVVFYVSLRLPSSSISVLINLISFDIIPTVEFLIATHRIQFSLYSITRHDIYKNKKEMKNKNRKKKVKPERKLKNPEN